MKHFYLDEYCDIASPVHKLDARIKIVMIVLMLLTIIFTPPRSYMAFVLYLFLLGVLVLLSKVPVSFVLRRALIIIPFVLTIAIFIPFFKEGQSAGEYSMGALRIKFTYSGLTILWNTLVKSFLAVICMTILIATTRFTILLKALEKMKTPKLFVIILSFLYRYIFLLTGEIEKMNQAKESRSVGGSRWYHTRTLANMIGMLFVRSYERGENVYMAMRSRGFAGEIKTMDGPAITKYDVCFLLIVSLFLALARIIGA